MNPHQVLGIRPNTSLDDIKSAYRRRMMQCHPDKGGSEEEAKMVNLAYELLTKPKPEPVRVYYQRPTVVVRIFTGYHAGYNGSYTSTSTTTTGWW